jgi:hypothetical protein
MKDQKGRALTYQAILPLIKTLMLLCKLYCIFLGWELRCCDSRLKGEAAGLGEIGACLLATKICCMGFEVRFLYLGCLLVVLLTTTPVYFAT